MTSSRGPALRLLLLCVFGALVCSSSAASYKLAWTIPSGPTFFDDWAGTKSFEVGDSIEFDYPAGAHNVYLVSPADAASCDTSNPIQEWNGASPVVTLDKTGTASFVCGLPGHCLMGMKLTVQVLASAAPPPAPPAPRQPPPTKPPPAVPASPPPSPRRRSPVPPVAEPVAAPAPSPPKKKKPSYTKGGIAPAPGPAAFSDGPSSIAPAPFPETAAASVLRSTVLVIVATLLVSCGALLF